MTAVLKIKRLVSGMKRSERLTQRDSGGDGGASERRYALRHSLACGVHFIYCQAHFLIGKLTNLSSSGLSFEYATTYKRTSERMKVDILSNQHELTQLSQLVCRRIYDYIGLAEKQSFRGTAIRQCGVAFEDLTPAQKSELVDLIQQQGGCTPVVLKDR